ncbi:MAG: hypothetical protein Kow001_15010 [Acidobacteriota bacterium]
MPQSLSRVIVPIVLRERFGRQAGSGVRFDEQWLLELKSPLQMIWV